MKTRILILAAASFAAALSAAQLTLNWRDNSDNEAAFQVERSPDGVAWAEIAVLPPDSTTYTDATLETGQTYFYRVRAANEYGFSGYTNVASAIANGPPSAPDAPVLSPASPTLRITVRADGTISIEPI